MISIVITSRNSEKTIERTLASVVSQKLVKFEVIVLDCQSEDNTLAIIEKYRSFISYLKSERDKGLYYAWNDSIKIAKGEFIFFLNSDDYFYDDYSLYNLYRPFTEQSNLTLTHGNLVSVDVLSDYKEVKGAVADTFSFLFGMSKFLTLAALFKKECLIELGGFNVSYRISADYDLSLRYFKKYHTSTICYVNNIIFVFEVGGMSTSSQNFAYDEIDKIVRNEFPYYQYSIYKIWNGWRRIRLIFYNSLGKTVIWKCYRMLKSKRL